LDADLTLLHGIARGDEHAMHVLFARYNARVYRFIVRLVGDSATAKDLVSDFLDVWREAEQFECPRLMGIAQSVFEHLHITPELAA
jgi:RNA polymerase sigma-70 factor, ECF subfamily